MATNKLIVENAKAVTEAKAVEVKETVKKADTAVKATAKKATKAVKTTAKKADAAVKTTARKAKKATASTYAEIQFAGKNYTMDDIVKIATDACKAANKRKAITDMKVYVKPEESKVYYVANDGAFVGSADL